VNAPNDCVFPFVYNGQAYHDCTEDDRAKAWCSLTYEYDKDLKWGHCNPCRGETLSIEQSLLEHCSLVREQMDGWVWDPFLEEVRSEYLNCEKVGTGLPVNIPISQSIVLDPKLSTTANRTITLKSPMHFAPKLYFHLHRITLSCMDAFIESDQNSNADEKITKRSQWKALLHGTGGNSQRLLAQRATEHMKQCMDESMDAARKADCETLLGPRSCEYSMCSCDQRTFHTWTIENFFSDKVKATHVCSGGKLKDQICTPSLRSSDDPCKMDGENSPNDRCELAFKEQSELSRSSLYGCYFEHPDAQKQIEPSYHQCGWNLQVC
jgi:hypothetical protein